MPWIQKSLLKPHSLFGCLRGCVLGAGRATAEDLDYDIDYFLTFILMICLFLPSSTLIPLPPVCMRPSDSLPRAGSSPRLQQSNKQTTQYKDRGIGKKQPNQSAWLCFPFSSAPWESARFGILLQCLKERWFEKQQCKPMHVYSRVINFWPALCQCRCPRWLRRF